MKSNEEKYQEYLDRLLKGDLSDSEQKELRKAAADDADLQRQLEEHIEARANIRLAGEKDLKAQLMNSYEYSTKVEKAQPKVKRLWAYAAAAMIALAVGFFFLLPQNEQEFQVADYLNNPPSMVVRGEQSEAFMDIWMEGESAYKKKTYEESARIFEEIKNTYPEAKNHDGKLHIYLGISHLQQGNFVKAMEALQKIDTKNPLFEEAEWYIVLTQIAQGDLAKAKKILTEFANDPTHFKTKDAQQILRMIH